MDISPCRVALWVTSRSWVTCLLDERKLTGGTPLFMQSGLYLSNLHPKSDLVRLGKTLHFGYIFVLTGFSAASRLPLPTECFLLSPTNIPRPQDLPQKEGKKKEPLKRCGTEWLQLKTRFFFIQSLDAGQESSSADHARHNPRSAFDLHSKGQPCFNPTTITRLYHALHTDSSPNNSVTQHSQRPTFSDIRSRTLFAQVISKPHNS